MITLASYNKFHNQVWSDSFIVVVGNCATSIFAGFIVFSYIGYMAHELGIDADKAVDSGPALVFGVYASALATIPASSFFNFVFFFMVVMIGIDSQFVVVETCITAILDLFPRLRSHKLLVVISFAIMNFLVGLPYCLQGGKDLLDLFDWYATGYNSMLITVFESVAVGWAYGATLFLNDIELMIGKKFHKVWRWIYWLHWKIISPLILLVICIWGWAEGHEDPPGFPYWAVVVGECVT